MAELGDHRTRADLVLSFMSPDGQVVEGHLPVDLLIPIKADGPTAPSVVDGEPVAVVQITPLVDRARIEIDGVTIGELNPGRAPELTAVALRVHGSEVGAWSLS